MVSDYSTYVSASVKELLNVLQEKIEFPANQCESMEEF